MSDNPLDALRAPPEGADPKAQLEYLRDVVKAFSGIQEPRLKFLSTKLDAAVADWTAGSGAKDGERFVARINALQIETFELIVVVVTQIRSSLRLQLQRGLPKPQRLDIEKMQKQLGDFSQGMRKAAAALKSDDPAKRADAQRLLAESEQAMKALEEQID